MEMVSVICIIKHNLCTNFEVFAHFLPFLKDSLANGAEILHAPF